MRTLLSSHLCIEQNREIMKQLLVYAMAVILMTSCNQNTNENINKSETLKEQDMQKEEKQKIETLLSTYLQSLNTSDAKLAQSLYTRNGVFMPAEGPSAIGLENILKSYEYVFSQIQLNVEFFIEEIEVENDFAFAITSSKGTTLIHATGDTIPEANRELFVFEKVADEWKIARYMFNKAEPKK